MIVEIDKNGELVIKSETNFEEIYLQNWYVKNGKKPSKETIRFALQDK
tara:strand:- start:50 stop:193 length:144 start_codon:yes stop_codon:yes gene_type:complete